MRIFSIALCHSSPSGISSNINHWRESPFDSNSWTLYCCNSTSSLNKSRIKRGSLCEGYRKDSSISMDNISTKNQRNFESWLFHGDFLHLIGILNFPNIDNGADSTINKSLNNILWYGLISTGHLEKLSNFFFNSHNGEILLDSFLYIFWTFNLLNHILQMLKINSLTLHLNHLLLANINTHCNNKKVDIR